MAPPTERRRSLHSCRAIFAMSNKTMEDRHPRAIGGSETPPATSSRSWMSMTSGPRGPCGCWSTSYRASPRPTWSTGTPKSCAEPPEPAPMNPLGVRLDTRAEPPHPGAGATRVDEVQKSDAGSPHAPPQSSRPDHPPPAAGANDALMLYAEVLFPDRRLVP